MAFPYLQALTVRLAERLGECPDEFRRRHGAYLTRCQNPDGGFSGREGDSDLYYTAFGLRGLAVLGELAPEAGRRAAGYLRACLAGYANVVDFFSLLFARMILQVDAGIDVLDQSAADWQERVAVTLESFRAPDGGYGKSAGAKSGSTYHTFLVGLCYQLLDVP